MEVSTVIRADINGKRCGDCEHLIHLDGYIYRCSLADEGMVSEDGGLPFRNFMCLKLFNEVK